VRVFLDTKVLVSAFTTRGLSADVLRLVLVEHELITGQFNLEEFRRVLRARMNAPDALIAEAEQLLREQDVVPRPVEPYPIEIRDPDDAWVLASAVAGAAEVIVTGDSDLLDLGSETPLRILTPREFWELSRRGAS
jgi:putative PIN family toxin of toxin-antitoxin system